MEALIAEIHGRSAQFKAAYTIDTVFIGGGTPSLVSGSEIEKMIDAAAVSFDIDKKAEITIESNPDSLTPGKLSAYRSCGINRISMGFQSMDDRVLRAAGRVHDSAQARKAYDMARKAGFDNINTDLMFALPQQDERSWDETLAEIIDMDPEHVSFYSLQLERNTPLYEDYKNGRTEIADDDSDRRMYHHACRRLEAAGYEHYEISNSAKRGYMCRHNLKYWRLEEFLGLGLGASSYTRGPSSGICGSRYMNTENISTYLKLVADKEWPVEMKSYHTDDMKESMAVYTFTSLRTKEGVDTADFKKRFGCGFFEAYRAKAEKIRDYEKRGLLKATADRISLTEHGIDVSNDIMSEFV